jgi:hypothetical protein
MEGMATSADPADTHQWFRVDLGEKFIPRKIVFAWRDIAFPKEYHILASEDGEEWEVLASNLDAGEGEKIRTEGGMPALCHKVKFPFLFKSFRYIQVLIEKGADYYVKYPQYKFVQILNFKVFPKEEFAIRSD